MTNLLKKLRIRIENSIAFDDFLVISGLMVLAFAVGALAGFGLGVNSRG